jgi:(S)-ureidoglycine aminohydrolase
MGQKGLVTSRVVVERNYALLPPEGIPESVLPEWTSTAARIHAAPALGARFAQYLLDVQPGGGSDQVLAKHLEAFFFVIEGSVDLTANGIGHVLTAGGFAYLKPGSAFQVAARAASRVLWLKKAYEPWGRSAPVDVIGNESKIKGEPFMEIQELLLKKLLPEDPAYDMAMNIFTFPPGYSLPVTETHVMEHGLYMLEGQGVYYLGSRWYETLAGDFIWMGPYCPQSFYAAGPTPAKYIYYKNVNREIPL